MSPLDVYLAGVMVMLVVHAAIDIEIQASVERLGVKLPWWNLPVRLVAILAMVAAWPLVMMWVLVSVVKDAIDT